ncbi:hypothetical protein DMB66_31660 [Actinoplanes sp. ATCC 53533]|uniref:hypothetical protein n=1 Tax=Actinoplanes sp. ATCC 53533 TaxID=1288362 RepID=UPI000F78B448|nr:hypothetical protein [Actinoplanes sp. ATCC 53533]RSM57782.1 hypothetical protein DMB66_31660 [Actinoplanes sp. ATCC 53533]
MQVIPILRRVAVMEAAMWRSMFVWLRRKPLTTAPGDEVFSYLGVVKPILGVFIGLSAVELPIFDLIIRNVVPWEPARWIALGLGVWGLLWMIGLFASLKINPHVVGAAGLRVRAGSTIDFTVDWADVDTVSKAYRSLPSSKSVQVEQDGDRTVLNIVTGGQTSVDVRLRRPVSVGLPKGPSEPAEELRLYADDPDGFVRACRRAAAADHAIMRHAQES